MKLNFNSFLLLIICIFIGSNILSGQANTSSEIMIDFDNCESNVTGENMNYDEFNGEITNGSSGPILELIGNRLYRNNPESNPHSCVMGLEFTSAMCVGALSSCVYEPGNTKSVKFDVKVTAASGSQAVLNNLSFYEASPTTFSWISGTSGNNNYPTKFAVRVLRDGEVIYDRSEINSTRGFSLESFDFQNNPNFTVQNMAIFNFELLAYCPINNGANLSLWDLDDLRINAVSIDASEHNISGGPFSFCTGDGSVDTISLDQITLSGEGTNNTQWIITDSSGMILALPQSFTDVNFDNSGNGNCNIYHLNYSGSISGLFIASNISNLIGDFSLSNAVLVERNEVDGGQLNGGPFNFCNGDGLPDLILDSDFTLSDEKGSLSQWVITDPQGNILALTSSLSQVDFENTPPGICLVWNLSYEDGLTGAVVGNNALNDLSGCFDLSNPITVNRSTPEAATLSGGPFSLCIDGLRDTIATDEITAIGGMGSQSAWVVTDTNGVILGLPPHFSDVNFDDAGTGVCYIWLLSFEGDLQGDTVGGNANDIIGCHALSNPITVNRSTPQAATLSGGPFSFCVDGLRDTIATDEITANGGMGSQSAWVVTDTNGVILGLPQHFSDVNLDDAGAGVCYIWLLSFEGDLQGDTVGGNANDIIGCHALSNPITVNRSTPEAATLSGGPFSFCVDGIRDTIATDEITANGGMGSQSAWVVTDTNGVILGLPPHFSDVNFDDAGAGVCYIWLLSFEGDLQGDTVGGNANDIIGCHALSNPITVNRSTPEAATLSGGPFSFCVDGLRDTIATDEITATGAMGSQSAWVVTDTNGVILGLPQHFSDVNLDDAGAGVCYIWLLSFEGDLQGDTVGGNANDIIGCHALSNPITVNRSTPEAATLSGGPFSFCVDGIRDTIATDEITANGGMGSQSAWVVTDTNGVILGLPPHFSDVNFDDAGTGVCYIWLLSFEDDLQGDTVGGNANDIIGCHALSNPITVNRSTPEAATLSGGPFSFCVDGLRDTIAIDEITATGGMGSQSAWVVTDTNGVILGLPPHFSDVNFDDAGTGVCYIWLLSFEGDLQGDTVGGNANDIIGCHALSNPITVNRSTPEAATLSGGPFSFCVDGIRDTIATDEITANGGMGSQSAWVVTDTNGVILGLPQHFSDVNLDDAGAGVCYIWLLSFEGDLQGDTVGGNANDIIGCHALSNPITVNRSTPEAATLSGGPFSFCVDGLRDTIATDEITATGGMGSQSAWVVTDTNGVILGLPPHFSDVNFDDAGTGVCYIWLLSFEGDLQGDTVGGNANDIIGCHALSNPITVNRSTPEAATLSGGPFSLCIDGLRDTIATDEITATGGMGSQSAWVVTDTNGVILGLPPHFSDVNFDDAGTGVCYIWLLSFEGDLQGDTVGGNANDIIGCHELSNPITVNRSTPEAATLSGGPFSFCVDGLRDTIATDEITATGGMGSQSAWVVTDTNGVILGLPPHFSDVNFDDAGTGVCYIWLLSFEGDLQGDTVGGNANDIIGCHALSNPITVNRSTPEAATLLGGPFSFCVDGSRDTIATDEITATGVWASNLLG